MIWLCACSLLVLNRVNFISYTREMYLFSNFKNLFEYFFEKIINCDFFGVKVKPKVLLNSNMLFNYGLYLIASGQYIILIYIVTLFGSFIIVEISLITIRKRVVSTKQWRILRSIFYFKLWRWCTFIWYLNCSIDEVFCDKINYVYIEI